MDTVIVENNSFTKLIEKNNISRTKLMVDNGDPVIFLTLYDHTDNVYKKLSKAGLLLNNCDGLIVQNKIFKMFNKSFNNKDYSFDIRKVASKAKGRKLKITTTIPKVKPGKYMFYDMQQYSKAYKYASNKFSERVAFKLLLTEISKLKIRLSKNKNLATAKLQLLFVIDSSNSWLYEVLTHYKLYLNAHDLEHFDLFDNMLLVSTTTGNINVPIISKNDDKYTVINKNILYVLNMLSKTTDVDVINTELSTSEESLSSTINKSSEIETDSNDYSTELKSDDVDTAEADDVEVKFDDINYADDDIVHTLFNKLGKSKNFIAVDGSITSELDDSESDNDNIELTVDTRKLRQILKQYKITNVDVIANIRSALDNYLQWCREHNSKLDDQSLNNIIFKAIHFSVHGTDNVDDRYIANPGLLIDKLSQQSIYKTKLELTQFDNKLAFEPDKVVNLAETSGVWTQKREFEKEIHKNVKKLFKSLETKLDNPVRIKNIKHEVVDTNDNRLIKYTITLQNKNNGFDKDYDVELEVPSIVNDRYFKLGNNSYIIANQQFMKPVTKTNNNEVRFISNYGVVNLSLENIKFDLSKILDILNYIEVRYDNIIKEKTDEYCTFIDDTTVYIAGETLFTDGDFSISEQPSGDITDSNGVTYREGRNELLFTKLRAQVSSENPEDSLAKSKKSIPYICIYISGFKIPFIFYLWSQKGLLQTLTDFSIDYSIDSERISKYNVKKADGTFLNIECNDIKDEYLCNGLLATKLLSDVTNLNDTDEIGIQLNKHYGQSTKYKIDRVTENAVDPITKEILEFENLPTDFVNVMSETCTNRLLNAPVDSLSDLKIYRSRLSEMMLNIMYQQIQKAHSKFSNDTNNGDDEAKLTFKSSYILENILSQGILQHVDSSNPIDEINLASRVIKSGPQGVPGKYSFKLSHRNIHDSHIGIIGANTTPESGDVGIVLSHTLTPLIMNEYGSYGKNDPAKMEGWQAVTINEALTPFQNQMDSDRLILAATHTKQVIPTTGNEAPLVGTGAEFVVPQISSKRFINVAKKNGTVVSVDDNKTITVQYDDKSKEVIDIFPRVSRTKMGIFMSLSMTTPLKTGDKFKKSAVLTHTKNFTKDGVYASGNNAKMAMMNYQGFSHEDAYVVSEKFSDTMKRDIIRKVEIVVPPDASVLKFEKEIGKEISFNDVLLEFSYDQNLEDYLNQNTLPDELVDDDMGDDTADNESLYGAGDNTIQLKGKSGEIIDIKIYINNKNSIDTKILQFYKNEVKSVKTTIAQLAADKKSDDKISVVDNIDLSFVNTGNHKLKGGIEFKGARVVYYIRQEQSLDIGDKIASRYGAKGVISKVITTDETPYTKELGPIDVFISPVGVFSRKNIAMVKELYIGKIMFLLNRQLSEMCVDKSMTNDKLYQYIDSVYATLAPTLAVRDNIKSTIEKQKNKLIQLIKKGEITFSIMIQPFENVTFKNIKSTATLMKIKLDEKVYMPNLKMWTKDVVPVGISYTQSLEQTSEIYSNVRGLGKYQSLTGQAVKGKARGGGQAIGNLDVNAFLTFDAPDVLAELMTFRSDDHASKRKAMQEIITTGRCSISNNNPKSKSKSLFDVYLTTMGLNINS